MRRFVPAALVSVIALAAFAVPASASIDHHFDVHSISTSSHNSKSGFRFSDVLVAPYDRSVRVGRDRGKCSFNQQHRKIHCTVVVNLNGTIGGRGAIKVRGDLERHDNKLYVSGGTHQFNGVGGKVLVHGNNVHFDLVK